MTLKVVGLDLSLSSTGVGCSLGWVDRVQTKPGGNLFGRLRLIESKVLHLVGYPDLVVVEGLAFSRQTGQHLTRAGMWHLVMNGVDQRGIRWAEVSPTALKKYATGRGNAGKDEVLAAAVRRFPSIEVRGNDEADGLWLAAMGADHLGEPMVEMPAVNRESLRKVVWPETAAA